MSDMKRREFITLIGGAAAAWPLAVRAQQSERVRRIGVLMSVVADDPEGKARFTAFQQGLEQLGWGDGRNVRIDTRWAAGDADRSRRYAAELIALTPERHPGSGQLDRGASRDPAATPPVSSCSNTASAGNGWSCSSRSRPA
jgi:putative tryptophan/tyrosine transport system substrate-binding protein